MCVPLVPKGKNLSWNVEEANQCGSDEPMFTLKTVLIMERMVIYVVNL